MVRRGDEDEVAGLAAPLARRRHVEAMASSYSWLFLWYYTDIESRMNDINIYIYIRIINGVFF